MEGVLEIKLTHGVDDLCLVDVSETFGAVELVPVDRDELNTA